MKSGVVKESRQTLIHSWELLFFVGLVIFVLYQMFPEDFLINDLEREIIPNKLTRTYINSMQVVYPDNPGLKLLEAQFYLLRKNSYETTSVLKGLEETSLTKSESIQKQWIEYQLVRNKLKEKDPDGPSELFKMMDKLLKMDLKPHIIFNLIRDSFYLKQPKLALKAIQQLKKSHYPFKPQFLVGAAETSLGQGDYLTSSKLFFLAQSYASTVGLKRVCFIKGLKSLQSGNMLTLAMKYAEENIKGLEMDRETLLFLVDLATAAGRMDVAEMYLQRALRNLKQ